MDYAKYEMINANATIPTKANKQLSDNSKNSSKPYFDIAYMAIHNLTYVLRLTVPIICCL